MTAIERALTQGWINGAQDGYDGADFSLDDAGYFYVTGIMSPPNAYSSRGWFHGLQAQLDDVERPDGAIEAIRQAWGASTPLHQLPFAIDLILTTRTRTGFLDQEEGALKGTKSRGGGAYAFSEGTDAHKQWFLENPVTTAHIVPD